MTFSNGNIYAILYNETTHPHHRQHSHNVPCLFHENTTSIKTHNKMLYFKPILMKSGELITEAKAIK